MADVTFEEWEKKKVVEESWQEARRLVETWDAVEKAKERLRLRAPTDEEMLDVRRMIKEKIAAQGEWRERLSRAEMMKILHEKFPEDE